MGIIYNSSELSRINILLGKNGSGKSRFLRFFNSEIHSREIAVKYISPERAGFLQYESSIDQSLRQDPNYFDSKRNRNQLAGFKQSSLVLFRKFMESLDYRYAREMSDKKSKDYEDLINEYMDNIQIEYTESGDFEFHIKQPKLKISADSISSGESEFITLLFEILVFSDTVIKYEGAYILLDEPDVHLHPDLQYKLMHFLEKIVLENPKIKVIIATHSTSIIAAFDGEIKPAIAFMSSDTKNLEFNEVSNIYEDVLPLLGAHSLSIVLKKTLILLVEGEDDVRIWQQVVRSSKGKFTVYPCPTNGVDNMSKYESIVKNIINSIYDDLKCFSLRDGDGVADSITNDLPIVRMRLSCRASENLFLSNNCLRKFNKTWDEIIVEMDTWIDDNPNHKYICEMRNFKVNGYDRKNHDLKNIRYIIFYRIIDCSKSWEVIIGQSIAELLINKNCDILKENSLENYLGEDVVIELLKLGVACEI